eukprot:scaffold66997_cov54-Phaeocystis_antarctica.AAC.1
MDRESLRRQRVHAFHTGVGRHRRFGRWGVLLTQTAGRPAVTQVVAVLIAGPCSRSPAALAAVNWQRRGQPCGLGCPRQRPPTSSAEAQPYASLAVGPAAAATAPQVPAATAGSPLASLPAIGASAPQCPRSPRAPGGQFIVSALQLSTHHTSVTPLSSCTHLGCRLRQTIILAPPIELHIEGAVAAATPPSARCAHSQRAQREREHGTDAGVFEVEGCLLWVATTERAFKATSHQN